MIALAFPSRWWLRRTPRGLIAGVLAVAGFFTFAGMARGGEAAARDRAKVEDEYLGFVRRMKPAEKKERGDLLNEMLGLSGETRPSFKFSLKGVRKPMLERLRKATDEKALTPLIREMEKDLVAAREPALALIFDEAAYPYPHDPGTPAGTLHEETQKKINDLVAAVRLCWDPFSKKSDAALPRIVEKKPELKQWVDDLLEVDGAFQAVGETPDPPFDPALFADDIRVIWRNLLIDAPSRDTLKYNETLEKHLYPGEAECVRATNDYRLMMGRPAVEIDLRLVAAARNHSREMRDLNYFAHESPVEENRNFANRARHQNFAGAAGENIALGSRTGNEAFASWYTSSGHHRNMLGKNHVQIGVGYAGSPGARMGAGHLWTMVFGRAAAHGDQEPPVIAYLKEWLMAAENKADVALKLARLAQKLELPWHLEQQLKVLEQIDPSNPEIKKLRAAAPPASKQTPSKTTGQKPAGAGAGTKKKP
ncbi:MAG: CAP domain-containing protein [Planctomycetes bacterium]|nr:CAP domain-containing protein [Planctomycetota bacterium]